MLATCCMTFSSDAGKQQQAELSVNPGIMRVNNWCSHNHSVPIQPHRVGHDWSDSAVTAAAAPIQPFFFFFFSFIFISWRLITLQYCSGFCHTLTWISHGVTCIPHPNPPSHLPLYLIPLGLSSAPGPSTCLMHHFQCNTFKIRPGRTLMHSRLSILYAFSTYNIFNLKWFIYT